MIKAGIAIKALGAEGAGQARIATLSAVDGDGDTYAPGAFAGEDGGGQTVKVLAAHEWGTVPIGKARVYERGDEALADFKLNLESPTAREWYAALKFDLDAERSGGQPVQEWSYGFRIADSGIEMRNGERVRVLKRVKVHEISPVVLGAGVNTATLALKAERRRAEREDAARANRTKAAMSARDLETACRRTMARVDTALKRLERQYAERPAAASHAGAAYLADPGIARRAKSSVDAEIRSGAAAQGCRYRFKALPAREPDGGRAEFALEILDLAAVALGARERAPVLRWYAEAGPDEKADYGADDWDGHGFMESEDGSIWISDAVPLRDLAGIVGHEACHVVKHRGQDVSIEHEAEAYAFGDRFAALFGLPDFIGYGGPELIVVESGDDLPYRIYPGSKAWARGEMGLYQASYRGTPRDARWHCEWRLDGAENVYESARGSAALAWIEDLLDRRAPR